MSGIHTPQETHTAAKRTAPDLPKLFFDHRSPHGPDDYKAWLENFSPGKTFVIERVLAHGFKPALGHSGLTASVLTMHRDFVAVLGSLHREKKVSSLFYRSALLLEYLKLPLRWPRAWMASRRVGGPPR